MSNKALQVPKTKIIELSFHYGCKTFEKFKEFKKKSALQELKLALNIT